MSEANGGAALITGGASGIGLAIAHGLAQRGIGLALLDRDAAGLEAAAQELGGQVRVTTTALDVTDDDALTRAFDEAERTHGGLAYVLNNAAIMTGLPVYPAVSQSKIDEVLAINLRAVIVGTRLGHAALSRAGGGSILNTASGAGKAAFPMDPVYAATKAAVVMLTRSCAPVFAEAKIRINSICPSITDTPILLQNENGKRPAILESGEIPLLRPEEVAEATIELLLDPARSGETPSVLPTAPTR